MVGTLKISDIVMAYYRLAHNGATCRVYLCITFMVVDKG